MRHAAARMPQQSLLLNLPDGAVFVFGPNADVKSSGLLHVAGSKGVSSPWTMRSPKIISLPGTTIDEGCVRGCGARASCYHRVFWLYIRAAAQRLAQTNLGLVPIVRGLKWLRGKAVVQVRLERELVGQVRRPAGPVR